MTVLSTTARQRLGEMIDLSGNTRAWAAEKIGISPQYLSDILSGRRDPSGKVATQIKAAFHIPVESWYREEVAS